MSSNQESLKRKSDSSSGSPLKRPVLNSPNQNASSVDPTIIRNVEFASIQDKYDQGDNDKVIRQSNIFIKDLTGLLGDTIKLQMKAWSNKGNFTEQLKYAEELIQMTPKDPEGFVNACHVFSARGQQKRVLETTMAGMNEFKHILEKSFESPNSIDIRTLRTSLYKLLIHSEEAIARLEIRVDFLDRLPYDLACKVTTYLPEKALIECSQVSRSWRDLILHYPVIWRTYYLQPTSDDILDIALFPKVTSYIEDLSYFSDYFELESPEIFDRFLQVVSSVSFPRLQKFQIFTDYRITKSPEVISSILLNISATVTEIDLTFHGEPAITLPEILMNFKKLTSLKYCCNSFNMGSFSVPKLPYKTLLQRAEIENENSAVTIGTEQLDNLFKNSPHLRAIGLYNIDEAVLTTIYQHCPNMVVLNFDDKDVSAIDILEQIPNDATGLHRLFTRFGPSVERLRQLMEGHRDTLKEIHAKSLLLRSSGPPLLAIHLPHVEKLVVETEFEELPAHHTISLLRHCPSTQSLTLRGDFSDHLKLTDSVFQAVGSLQHLEEIDIRDANVIANENAAIQSFQKLNALKKVNIHCGTYGATHILYNAVAHVPNLESLYLFGDRNRSTMDQLRDFTSRLAMLKNLRKIVFISMTLNTNVLKEFKNNNSLGSIQLRNIKGISKEQARDALPPHVSLTFNGHS